MKKSFYILLFIFSSSILFSQDITTPSLSDFSFSPSTLKISGSNLIVNFSVTATDDSSGIDKITVAFSPVDGAHGKSTQIKKINSTSTTVSGEINLGKAPTLGEWTASITIIDNDRNQISYSASDLENMEFEAKLTVESETDETPPELTSFSFSPGSLDLANNNNEISFTVSTSDDLSGIDEVSVNFSPSGNGGSKTETIKNINGENNFFSGTINLGNNPSEGDWLASISLKDVESNSITYSAADLKNLSFDNTLTVFTTVDSSAPQLTSFSFSPSSIDLSRNQNEISFSISTSDDLSGIDEISIQFSPEENGGSKSETYKKINGEYSSINDVLDFGNNPKEGIWKASIVLKDVAGNIVTYSPDDLETLGFPNTLELFSIEDTTPPLLQMFSSTRDTIDISGSDLSATLSITATDDMSGISKIEISFEPTSNGGKESIKFDKIDNTFFQISESFTFKKNSKEGIWKASIDLEDNERNKIAYSSEDLEEMGFSSNIFVISNTDTIPPVLVDFHFSPDSISMNEDDVVISYSVTASDEMSGLDDIRIEFTPEENGSKETIRINKIDSTFFHQSGEIQFNKNLKPGKWSVSLELSDNEKNTIFISSGELSSLGFNSQLIIGSTSFLALQYPNGGEVIEKNNKIDVQWDCDGINNVRIELSLDNGNSWNTIASSVAAQRKKYNWTAQVDPSENVLVKIYDEDNLELFDVSDSPWRISYTVTDINDREDLSLEYSMDQNYPNPFNPTTVIKYTLVNEGFVTLSVYNSLGEKVKNLVHGIKRSGNHSVNFNATKMPSGVYYYSIITKDFKQTRKMLYLK